MIFKVTEVGLSLSTISYESHRTAFFLVFMIFAEICMCLELSCGFYEQQKRFLNCHTFLLGSWIYIPESKTVPLELTYI